MARKLYFISILGLFIITKLSAQERVVPIDYGNMDKWMVREVNESGIIGGNTRYLYEIAQGDTLKDNTPYKKGVSPWATSTVLAKVSGIIKSSVTVFNEPRESGYSARLETRMEHVKVLGIINISVLATGTIFLGEIDEPVRDTKNPQAKLIQGLPFTGTPDYVQFDYKFINGNEGKRIKVSGFSKDKPIEGRNAGEVNLLLQYRWEDTDGNIYAKRVGTGCMRFEKDFTEWQNKTRVKILYGDIRENPNFKSYMNLVQEEPYYTKNSKGIPVPIREVGWADANTKPTHMILRFSSGYGGAYIGAPGAKLWVDNIALVYPK